MERPSAMRAATSILVLSALLSIAGCSPAPEPRAEAHASVAGMACAMSPTDAARKVNDSRSAPRAAFAALIMLSLLCLVVRRPSNAASARPRR